MKRRQPFLPPPVRGAAVSTHAPHRSLPVAIRTNPLLFQQTTTTPTPPPPAPSRRGPPGIVLVIAGLLIFMVVMAAIFILKSAHLNILDPCRGRVPTDPNQIPLGALTVQQTALLRDLRNALVDENGTLRNDSSDALMSILTPNATIDVPPEVIGSEALLVLLANLTSAFNTTTFVIVQVKGIDGVFTPRGKPWLFEEREALLYAQFRIGIETPGPTLHLFDLVLCAKLVTDVQHGCLAEHLQFFYTHHEGLIG